MRNATAGVIVSVMVLSGAATAVQAQTVFVGAGWTRGWDDETNLGKGLLVSGGVAHPLGRHLSLEGEVSWGRHCGIPGIWPRTGRRSSARRGSRICSRAPRRARGRSRAQGLGLVHSTGHFTTRSIVPRPRRLAGRRSVDPQRLVADQAGVRARRRRLHQIGRPAVVSAGGALDIDEPAMLPGHARPSSRRCGSSAPASRSNGACGADMATTTRCRRDIARR